MSRYRSTLLTSAMFIAWVPAAASAQTAPQPASGEPAAGDAPVANAAVPAPPAAPTDNGAIIVTAQKRSERLVDVPASITALTAKEVERRGIRSIQDLSFAVPGLTMREDGPGSYTIFLRGLANPQGSGALVGQYLNEAPLTISGYDQLSPYPLDLQRIEVLKGPQGTLYGLGSAAGTVRYITRQPSLTQSDGTASAELYGVDHGSIGTRLTGAVGVPLVTDRLAVRFAASYGAGGGWIDQPEAGIRNGNGTRQLTARGIVRWQATDRFSANAMVQIGRAHTRLGLGYEEPDRTVDIGPDRSKRLVPKQFNYDLYNLDLHYDFGFAELVSASSYINHKHRYPFTYIPRPGNFSYGYVEGNDDRKVKANQYSEEVRLASHAGSPLSWTLGAYYSNSYRSLLAIYEYAYAPAGDLYSGGGTTYSDLYYYSHTKSVNYSLFGDVSYRIGRFQAGAGVRSFHDRQHFLVEYAPDTGVVQKGTFKSVDPRVYASYHYTPDAQVYASYGSGFRSGGFNTAPFEPFGPEHIKTVELGTKGSVAGGKVQFDVAGFLTDYNDMIRRRLVNVGGQFLSELSNIGKVKAKGVEFGLWWRPVTGLSLMGNGAYTDSKIRRTDPEDTVNLPGDRTDYTPKWSYTLSAEYEAPLSRIVTGYGRVDFNHRSRVSYIDRSSFFPSALPQFSDVLNLLNLRAGARFGRTEAEIYAENVTDQNKAIDPYVGWANSNRTRPRTLGVRLSEQF